jgi:hypothetical protein
MFQTSPKFEVEEGINLDYGDFKIRICRAGGANKRFGKLLNSRLKPHRQRMATDTLPEEVALKIMIETYADTIVLGWDGVTDAENKPLDYNKENVIKLFTDLPELFRDVQRQADNQSLFRAADLEVDSKI